MNSISRIYPFVPTTQKVPACVFGWERRALALRRIIANTRGFSPGPSLAHHYKTLLAATILSILFLPLTGCGNGSASSDPNPTPVPTPPANTYSGTSFKGKVLSGSTPLQGAEIQIYAAGTTGNGSAATPLLTATLTTDSTGSFTVPAAYPCPAATSQLYLIARGGELSPTTTDNSAITLATVLGLCNQVAASTPVVINEVTTATTAWGLAQFFTTAVSLGASATNTQGLSNAFATVANLVNLATGVSPGAAFPSTGASPAAKVNTLANLLNTCTSAATTCANLFTLATPSGATAPTNTLDVALNIIHNPALNTSNLYTQSTTSTAFSPALTTAPADWTLFIRYTGGGMFEPDAIGIDSTGNIWVSSYTNPTGTLGIASKFSPTGAPQLVSGVSTPGLNNSYGLAIDASDNVWIPYEKSPSAINKGLGAVAVYNSSGQSISGTGFASGGLNFPIAAAIDPNGTAWIVNYGNATLTTLSSTGQPLSSATGYTAASFAFPTSIAIDASHNAWIGDQNDDAITRISPDGTQSLRVSCCNGPNGLAIDQHGNVWAANYFGDSISEISSTGAVISSGYTGGGIHHPQGLAIDGSGNVWIANYRGSSLTQLAGSASSNPGQPISPTAGWGPDSNMLEAFALAIDASGNLWVTNFGDDTLTEFVGLATPVKTPLLGPPQAP
ncbi:MAG TPA: NHL repeat-containing protein [Edaphobacter sp.]|nr:NHL repeat-containing protein [Edaphobacter sp.]